MGDIGLRWINGIVFPVNVYSNIYDSSKMNQESFIKDV